MLSQSVGYAAIALGYVAAAGGKPILVKEIAAASGMPASYLAKIINGLARKGLVLTQRGIGGGVVLARQATEITLYDLCVSLDDPCVLPRCMLGTAECSDERACPAHQFWTQYRNRYIDYLRRMTVADVAAFELRRRANGGVPPKADAAEADGRKRRTAPLPVGVEALLPGEEDLAGPGNAGKVAGGA
jgi:Rrf2 family transcriptional regulator, iron-sulfur cluster assembly transcription factor